MEKIAIMILHAIATIMILTMIIYSDDVPLLSSMSSSISSSMSSSLSILTSSSSNILILHNMKLLLSSYMFINYVILFYNNDISTSITISNDKKNYKNSKKDMKVGIYVSLSFIVESLINLTCNDTINIIANHYTYISILGLIEYR
jgi:hypothetical protein